MDKCIENNRKLHRVNRFTRYSIYVSNKKPFLWPAYDNIYLTTSKKFNCEHVHIRVAFVNGSVICCKSNPTEKYFMYQLYVDIVEKSRKISHRLHVSRLKYFCLVITAIPTTEHFGLNSWILDYSIKFAIKFSRPQVIRNNCFQVFLHLPFFCDYSLI